MRFPSFSTSYGSAWMQERGFCPFSLEGEGWDEGDL
jgi:hypothetical protein